MAVTLATNILKRNTTEYYNSMSAMNGFIKFIK